MINDLLVEKFKELELDDTFKLEEYDNYYILNIKAPNVLEWMMKVNSDMTYDEFKNKIKLLESSNEVDDLFETVWKYENNQNKGVTQVLYEIQTDIDWLYEIVEEL